ncbi:MAG: site-specific DNA-methyltransferase [Bacillota bacterium]|nr:site-specific DNA-methyltransferase [Bacillota bacterium]
MQTVHRIFNKDAETMTELDDKSVDLVVTSPPYPMIEMWDNLFCEKDSSIRPMIDRGNGDEAFNHMHLLLEPIWKELFRVTVEGGIVCINIGDAVRSLNGTFKIYSNHARIINFFSSVGFTTLPSVIWRKQTNAPTKFMGSGVLPSGAYITLEHEHILIFRKGEKRRFVSAEEKLNRRKSAIFWEERNAWYSDLWDIKGTRQERKGERTIRRSAAFPLQIPYRLICMFSVYGDTVLDPFMGTGSTLMAAMLAARNSIGYEIDEQYFPLVANRVIEEGWQHNNLIDKRLAEHNKFIDKAEKEGRKMKYVNNYYGFKVVTGQEKELTLYRIEKINKKESGIFMAEYGGLL